MAALHGPPADDPKSVYEMVCKRKHKGSYHKELTVELLNGRLQRTLVAHLDEDEPLRAKA